MYFNQLTADDSITTANRSISMAHFVDDLCDSSAGEATDSVAYPLAQKARALNTSLEELVGEIINADGTWQFDDEAFTNLPIGDGTLESAQRDYSFTSEYLKVERVKVLDVNGDYHIVKNLDQYDLEDTGVAIEEQFPATGLPEYYDIIGDTIRLYPAPTAVYATLASGLRVEFVRTIDFFTSNDSTRQPPIPSTHHKLLCYMMALPYCMKYHKDRVGWLEKQIDMGRKSLIKHYSTRLKDRRPIMTMAKISYI